MKLCVLAFLCASLPIAADRRVDVVVYGGTAGALLLRYRQLAKACLSLWWNQPRTWAEWYQAALASRT
jgi:hypothetical protein